MPEAVRPQARLNPSIELRCLPDLPQMARPSFVLDAGCYGCEVGCAGSPGLRSACFSRRRSRSVRAEDRVFDAMLGGWKAQMLARGLTTATIEGRCRVLRRFQEYAGTFPWTWRPVDLDDYMAERRSGEKPISLTTLRSDSNAIAMCRSYTSSSTYGWVELCEQTFGDVPVQIAFDWNTPRHTTDDAVRQGDERSRRRSCRGSSTSRTIWSTASTGPAASVGCPRCATRSRSRSATRTGFDAVR